MARSRRTYPIGSHAADRSEQWFKRRCSRVWRRRAREHLHHGRWEEARWDNWRHSSANNWIWPKDGKGWWTHPHLVERRWKLVRNRRKYAVARMPVRLRRDYQKDSDLWSATGRRGWVDWDRWMRK